MSTAIVETVYIPPFTHADVAGYGASATDGYGIRARLCVPGRHPDPAMRRVRGAA